MAESFDQLGLAEDLVATLAQRGYVRSTALQRAAIPVLRRGANVVLHAASGAGATAAYGVALIERLREAEAGPTPHALIVVPSEERAAAISLELGQLGRAAGITAGVPAAGWHSPMQLAVVPVQRVLPLLHSSQLKLADLKAIVLHDVSALLALSNADVLDTLMSTVPRDAQRILLTSSLTQATEKLAEAHARRALHVPARPAVPDTVQRPATGAVIAYSVLSGAEARQALAEAVAAASQPVVIFCRRPADCDSVQDEMTVRGLRADTRLYGDPARPGEYALGVGAPLDADAMTSAFEHGGLIVLEPMQLAHLRNVARQAHLALHAAAPHGTRDVSELERFRESIRTALQEEDIEAQMLVIEPLLAEFAAAEIAAAVTALLRRRPSVSKETGPQTMPAPIAPTAFVKLFLSVGQRDSITAREVVGTITGEANVSGDQIGRVEIRDTFTIVEIAGDAAERVIRALNGTSLRGRSLRVDYDRKTGPHKRTMPARRTHPRQ